MKYVYVLQSISHPEHYYTGVTSDLKRRFAKHNRGDNIHTTKYRPWTLITYMAFLDPRKADVFERYLKTSSGRTFAKRHF